MQQGRFRAAGMMIHHSRRLIQLLSCYLDYRTGGSLLDSRPRSLLKSADAPWVAKTAPSTPTAPFSGAQNIPKWTKPRKLFARFSVLQHRHNYLVTNIKN